MQVRAGRSLVRLLASLVVFNLLQEPRIGVLLSSTLHFPPLKLAFVCLSGN
jgi:hypothetical protein